MARDYGDPRAFTDLTRDTGGMIDTRDTPRYDRPIFEPHPRGTRSPPRPVYRQYPRSTSR